MTSIVTDFKSIRRKLERQEQKAEFEEKNPKVEPSMYGWPYGGMVPYVEDGLVQLKWSDETKPLKSMAHPEWPYQGTGFEWSKFVKVKI